MTTIRFHKKALLDFTESYDYYEEQSKGLGERFVTEADKIISLIQKHPLRARIIKANYRIVNIPDFPFQIIYTYNKALNRISLTAIHHAAKHPKKRFRKL